MESKNIMAKSTWGPDPEVTLFYPGYANEALHVDTFYRNASGCGAGPDANAGPNENPDQKLAYQKTQCDYEYRICKTVSDFKGWNNCYAQAQTAYLANIAAAQKDLQTAVAAEAVGGSGAQGIIDAAGAGGPTTPASAAGSGGASAGAGSSAAAGASGSGGGSSSTTMILIVLLLLGAAGGLIWYRKKQAASMAALTPQ